MAEHTPPSIDKVRSKAESIDNHEESKTTGMKTMSAKQYLKEAYPEGYPLYKEATDVKIEASGANLNLFAHRGAAFCTVIPEEVKQSGLSDESKNTLLRYAHVAWEIRANEENGEERYFFVLRDDVAVASAPAASEPSA